MKKESVKVDEEVKTEDIMTLQYWPQIDEPEKIKGMVTTGASFPTCLDDSMKMAQPNRKRQGSEKDQ